jgi:hypothetical protein
MNRLELHTVETFLKAAEERLMLQGVALTVERKGRAAAYDRLDAATAHYEACRTEMLSLIDLHKSDLEAENNARLDRMLARLP